MTLGCWKKEILKLLKNTSQNWNRNREKEKGKEMKKDRLTIIHCGSGLSKD